MKKILLIILLVVVCVGIIGGGTVGILRLTDSSKLDQKTISSTKFSVGGLDSNGKYMNTNASIYTKEAFECQGLNVNLSFDNEVEYQIYFYDQNNDFVHTTGKLSGAFVKDSVPFFAKYARIVVTPKNDDVVSKIEVLSYAKQLTIKVNREQGYKNYTENQIVLGSANKDYILTDGVYALTEKEGMNVSKHVAISDYAESMIVRANADFGSNKFITFNAEKNVVNCVFLSEVATKKLTTSTGNIYYSVDFKKLPETVKYIGLTYSSAYNTPELYLR